MNPPLISLFRTLSHPLEPNPTGVAPRRLLQGHAKIRAVLFDIYGTLLISGSGDVGSASSGPGRAASVTTALETIGFAGELDGERVITRLHENIGSRHDQLKRQGVSYPEIDIVDVWRETLESFAEIASIDVTAVDFRRFAIEYEARINPVWPMPFAAECLRGLYERGRTLGIVSNAQFFTPLAWSAVFEESLEQLGVPPSLQFFSYQHGHAKPGDHLYVLAREALAQLGIGASETLYLGNDMRNDILPASRVGFITGLFAGDRRSLRMHSEDQAVASLQPDMVVTDLRQLLEVAVEN